MLYRVRNFFIIFALVIAAFLLQYSVFIRIPVINCSPNLILIVTFCFAYFRDKNAGMLVGFMAGFFVDVFYGQVIGYTALVLVLVGLVCGSLKKVYYTNTLFSEMMVLMLADLSCSLIYYIVWYALQSRFSLGFCLTHVILPEFCFTLIMGLILMRPLRFIVKKMYRYREKEVENL